MGKPYILPLSGNEGLWRMSETTIYTHHNSSFSENTSGNWMRSTWFSVWVKLHDNVVVLSDCTISWHERWMIPVPAPSLHYWHQITASVNLPPNARISILDHITITMYRQPWSHSGYTPRNTTLSPTACFLKLWMRGMEVRSSHAGTA